MCSFALNYTDIPLQYFSEYVKTHKCQNERIQFHNEAYDQKVKGGGGVKANEKSNANGDDSDTIK